MKNKTKFKQLLLLLFVFTFSAGITFGQDCGDSNADRVTDIIDALLIAQCYVGLTSCPSAVIGDVNCDGLIDIIDAFLIVQFYVGLTSTLNCCGIPTDPPGPTPLEEDITLEMQAEEAQYSSGGVDTNHAGYTGSGFVNTDNASGEWIEWSIEVGNDCNATCVFRYASGGGARPMNLTINNTNEVGLDFAGSSAWDDWQTETADVILTAGSNTIRLTATGSGGAPNMDKMDITIYGGEVVAPPPTPTPTEVPTPALTHEPGWTPPPAQHWHECKGFGTTTKGGIAGEVYRVTNLNSSGAGSLRDAVSKSNRLVVFEVGGVINGGFSVASNVTVAGETAPYPGITTINGNVRTTGSNIVISHITHQMGKGGGADAWNGGGSNIVYNHIAVYWGTDETFPIQGSNNCTLYKCIIAEGLQFSGHGDGEHSKGLHIQSGNSNLAVIGSLGAHNALRNPRLDGGEAFIANYVVYNWGTGWDHQGPKVSSDDELADCTECFRKVISLRAGANVTLAGSIALGGYDSEAEFFLDGHNGSGSAYIEDNIIKDRYGNDLYMANTEGVFTGGASGDAGAITLLDSPQIWPDGMVPLPAHEALYEVLRTVGPQPGQRNEHNARIVKSVADGTGEIIDHQDEVGGYPNYTATYRALGDIPDGAEARQAWLDEFEDEIAVDTSIDLSRLYTMVGSEDSDILAP